MRENSITKGEYKIWLFTSSKDITRKNKGEMIHYAKWLFYFCFNHDDYAETSSNSFGDEVSGLRAGKWSL